MHIGLEAKIDGELVCGAECMAAAAAHKGAASAGGACCCGGGPVVYPWAALELVVLEAGGTLGLQV